MANIKREGARLPGVPDHVDRQVSVSVMWNVIANGIDPADRQSVYFSDPLVTLISTLGHVMSRMRTESEPTVFYLRFKGRWYTIKVAALVQIRCQQFKKMTNTLKYLK